MFSFLLSETLRAALPFSRTAGPFCAPVAGTEKSSCSAPSPGLWLVCSDLAVQIEWMSTSREGKRKDAAKEMEWGNKGLPSKGPVRLRGMELGVHDAFRVPAGPTPLTPSVRSLMMKTESFLRRLGKLGSPGLCSWEWKKHWEGLEGQCVSSAFTLGVSFLWGVNSASRKSEKHRVAPERRGLKQSSGPLLGQLLEWRQRFRKVADKDPWRSEWSFPALYPQELEHHWGCRKAPSTPT